ncbi:hypothetical protein B1C78_09295 [Thioalkalivibrio denitrificans]|uniref:Uncharacterized protein n=1 Tax=Thioalkalivibrio denitrificans TaxID=108003 RepID=A0A1V3NGA4_9GAMM|nr:hypothetical protein B1C78_09295 [Thioalkalivibrio denitrificans]
MVEPTLEIPPLFSHAYSVPLVGLTPLGAREQSGPTRPSPSKDCSMAGVPALRLFPWIPHYVRGSSPWMLG